HYCGPCERGCSTGSYFSSQASTLPAARATGRLTIVPDSVVHSLIYDAAKSRVTGVRVVDTTTKQTREYSGRLVFLCASTLATTRVLLNSKSPSFPNGLANSSGVLGHYLMDHHFRAGASGTNRPTSSGSPCSASIAPGARTSSRCARTWPPRRPRCWRRPAARTYAPTTPIEKAGSARSPGSGSTKWARPAWDATREPRSSMAITRRTTSPTCSSPMARPGLRHRADGALEDRGWHDQEDRERQGAPRSGRAAAERRRPDDRGDVRGFRAELGVEGHAGREQRRQVQRLRGAVPSPGRGDDPRGGRPGQHRAESLRAGVRVPDAG